MLEKNKDYLEMRVFSTDCAFTQNAAMTISIEGFSYDTSFRLPDPGESYVIISKEKFEKLQESVVYYMALSTRAQYWKDKSEQLQTENEELKKKLHEFDPMPDYKELLKTLYSTEDVEKLEWTLNHVCGGMGSVNGWWAVSSFWKRNYKILSKLVGFSSVEEVEDYLVNEAECDTLHEAISKLHDQVKYTCDEWKDMKKKLEECEKDYISARDKAEALEKENEQLRNERAHIVYLNDPLGVIAKWEKATGYDRPEDFLKWKANIEGIMEAWKDGTGCKYPGDARRLLEKWQTMTKCDTPEVAATWITSYESACERGNNLAIRVAKWKEATGCDSPDQVKSRIEGLENAVRLTNKNMLREIESTIDEWQKATGCVSPGKAERKITDLYNRIDKMKEAASIASNWTDKIVEG